MVESAQATLAESAKTALALLAGNFREQDDQVRTVVLDPGILRSLEVFDARPKHWLRVNCSCGRRLTRATYDDGGIFLGHEVREGLPGGGTAIRFAPGPTPNVEIAQEPSPGGFEQEPAGAHVWARRKFRCPSCHSTFTHSSVGLLTAWLRAVAAGSDVLVLGQRPSTSRNVPV